MLLFCSHTGAICSYLQQVIRRVLLEEKSVFWEFLLEKKNLSPISHNMFMLGGETLDFQFY